MNTTTSITDYRNATCYALSVDFLDIPNSTDGLSLNELIPKLVMPIVFSMGVNMGFNAALRPLHIPRIVSDMLGGFMLSPALVDTLHPGWGRKLWPGDTKEILDALAYLGLIFATFIAGVNIKLPPFSQLGKKAGVVASLVTILPTILGSAMIYPLLKPFGDEVPKVAFYWAAVVSSSSFVALIPCLTRLKLIYTDLGREAVSVGFFNEFWSWFWIVLVIAFSAGRKEAIPAVLGFVLVFTLICFLLVPPTVNWITNRKQEGENFNTATINAVLFVVLSCGLLSDMCGVSSLFAAFTFGLAMPQGVLATRVQERMDDCVSGVLMPLYFSLTGIKLSFEHLRKFPRFWSTLIVPVFAKTVCCFLASFFVKMAPGDAISLGLLTSTKDLLAVILITVGYERKHLPRESFTELWLSILVSSMLGAPLVSLLYLKGVKNALPYINRTVQGLKPNDDFRILASIHAPRNIHGLINLLEISDIAPTCPMSVFALHIVEVIGHGSSMFLIHDSGDSSSTSWAAGANPFLNRKGSLSGHVITAFKNYAEDHIASTTLRAMTIFCPTDTMHEDICSVAGDQQVAFLILTYNKPQTLDSELEETDPEFGPVIQNTMDNAPCTVGLLVDKGFGALPLAKGMRGESSESRLHELDRSEVRIGMIYVGGPDDREALTLAWRLAAHHLVNLTVIRFLVGDQAVKVEPIADGFDEDDEDEPFTILTQSDNEKELDAEFFHLFRQKTQNDEAIMYVEKVSNSGDETVNILRQMDHNYDLYITGRGRCALSPLTFGLAEWSESPELGAVGEVLVTSDFSCHVSVLVVQQYNSARTHGHFEDQQCASL